jgi:hypothetical protein
MACHVLEEEGDEEVLVLSPILTGCVKIAAGIAGNRGGGYTLESSSL